MTTETQAAVAPARGEKTELVGKVTSAKMEKTIVVEVQRLVQHPKYRRVVRISKKFYAHDEKREAKQGDTVRIVSSRPLSRLKRWRLKEVLTPSASAKKVRTGEPNHDSDANLADGGRQFRSTKAHVHPPGRR
jgi:small subunit ribosomal protein S17